MSWWEENNLRLIQTNLRAVDATADCRSLADSFRDMHANAVLLNTGGIMSFYPSSLPYEHVNPYLGDRDFIGEMVDLCHERGIRVISRFDFSKVVEVLYQRNPKWAYISKDHEVIRYNGLVHTCINSEYQKLLSLEMIDEVLGRYPVDGVFFNMFGFVTRDYSNNYHGICQCDSCRVQFHDRYGLDLPLVEDMSDPVYMKYREFQRICVDERLESIYGLVKLHDADIAVCNYATSYVDVVMNESNTEMHRPYPLWNYSASENVSRVYGTFNDRTSGNICINASSIDYRFHGVSEHQVRTRLYQSLASCGQLLWCIIGVFDGYPDRKNFESVRDIYRMHEDNERYFGRRFPIHQVVLLRSSCTDQRSYSEFRGIFKALKESHILVSVVDESWLESRHIAECPVVIVPDILPSEHVLDLLSTCTGKVLWTGTRWMESEHASRIMTMFGIVSCEQPRDGRWHYVLTDNLLGMELTDWALVEDDIVPVLKSENPSLELLSSGLFGPPELCGGNERQGVYLGSTGNAGTLLSFYPGALYHRYGFLEHRCFVIDMVLRLLDGLSLETNAPENVEISLACNERGEKLLCLVNQSGFNGSSCYAPSAVSCIRVILPKEKHLSVSKVLADSMDCDVFLGNDTTNGVTLQILRLNEFMMIVLEKNDAETD